MTNNKPEANCPTEWSANAQDENLMQKVLAAKEKMLHTSRLYLKGEATPMDSDLKAQRRTAHSNETLAAH